MNPSADRDRKRCRVMVAGSRSRAAGMTTAAIVTPAERSESRGL
jgi:hypothetical protein